MLLAMTPAVCAAPFQDAKPWQTEQALHRLKSAAPIEATELPALVATLSSSSAKVRLAALDFWARRSEEAYDALAEDDEDVANRDGTSLGSFSKQVVAGIDKAIDDPDPRIHRQALRTLCILQGSAESVFGVGIICGTGSEMTIPGQAWPAMRDRAPSLRSELAALAADPDPNVVLNALQSLPEEDVARLQPTIRSFLTSRQKLIRGIGLRLLVVNDDREVFRWVAPLIDDPDGDVREAAGYKFERVIKDAAAAFPDRMSRSPRVRAEIASLIAAGKAPNRVAMLREMLRDPADVVRAAALSGLAPYSGDADSPLSESEVRSYLTDRCGAARASAVAELYRRNVPDINLILRAALTDADPDVRDCATSCCMRSFVAELTQAVVKAVEMGVHDDWMICHYFSDPSNDKLLDGWLKSPNARVRRAAALSMNPREEPTRFVPRLFMLVDDPDPKVVGFAISGLIDVPGREASEALRRIAKRSRGEQLIDVLQAIGYRKDPSLADVAKSQLNSRDREVKRAAKNALRQLATLPAAK